MGIITEYRVLDKLRVITEGTTANKKLRVRGRFQKCDEQNNNGRIYPRPVLESQVKAMQDKINERSLVGALDHPPNNEIHLSQASHLITKLWLEPNGDVMGEAEILSTPSGKIVEALLNDNVKIGISSRGIGTLSENKTGAKIVNEDFRLITFDLVSDPSTKGAYPELTESVKLNSAKAQKIVNKMKQERILLVTLEQKINEGLVKRANKDKKNRILTGGISNSPEHKRRIRSTNKRNSNTPEEVASKVKSSRTQTASAIKNIKGSNASPEAKKYAIGDAKGSHKIKSDLASDPKYRKKYRDMSKMESTDVYQELLSIVADRLNEGFVKKINKHAKKYGETKQGEKDYKHVDVPQADKSPAYRSMHRSGSSNFRDTKQRRDIHKSKRGVKTKGKFDESVYKELANIMVSRLQEGLVKKANKAKKKEWEVKTGHSSPASQNTYNASPKNAARAKNYHEYEGKKKARLERNRHTKGPYSN